jgi:pyridoxine/pyridoxamine 5'-phosphate oxidase
MELITLAKAELRRSNADRKHPFRYFNFATLGEFPEVRTVVSRKVDLDLTLTFFTDARSPKVQQIKKNKQVSALFYHPGKKLQIRMNGLAELVDQRHGDFDRLLNEVKQTSSLKDYTTLQAPGSTVPDEAKLLFGDEVYFLAIKIKPIKLDVLQLGREGHRRSAYAKNESGEWEEAVLVP